MMAEIMLIIVVNNESSPDTYRKISNITFRDQNKHRKKGKLQTAENAGRKWKLKKKPTILLKDIKEGIKFIKYKKWYEKVSDNKEDLLKNKNKTAALTLKRRVATKTQQ